MSEFDIEYKPRTAIKSQVLANFVANFSLGLLPLETKEAATVSKSTSGVWNLFTDEASNVKRSGLGIVLITPSGETLRQAIRTIHLTNNEVEYEVLTAGLELDQGLDSEVIEIKCDSQLVVNQVYGIFDTKEERMQQYVIKVQDLLAQFREWSITHIAREKNAEADALANLGSLTEIKEIEFGAVVKLLNLVLDTDGYYEVNSTSLFWEWRNEIIYYLEHGKWPEDHKASRALHVKAARYCFKRGQLYRKFFQEALIPVEVGEPTLRYFQANEKSNNEVMLINLELLEERKDLARVRMAAQKQRMERYYNQRDNLRCFKVGDLVQRKVTQNTWELNAGKLGPTWKGPYNILTITGKGSYELENQEGDKLPSNWNMTHLKRYYC
ncbi:uncharacterized protein [Nicotiana sylvestris]|uniref:uncharacterized protein n=1 Tax=Nicotiana sylvestris TaxID=4096 RepID=UPI00388CA540